LKDVEGIHVMADVGPGYLNAGLMKPWRGFTLVAGEKKPGVGKFSKNELVKWEALKIEESPII
jgi:hypothetical protein